MRIFYFSLALLLILLVGLFFYGDFLSSSSDAMLSEISRLSDAAEKADWTETERALAAVRQTWEETSPRLALFTDHALLDEIMLTTAAAEGYVKYRESPELMAEIETLRSLVSHIPKREKLSLYNIF